VLENRTSAVNPLISLSFASLASRRYRMLAMMWFYIMYATDVFVLF